MYGVRLPAVTFLRGKMIEGTSQTLELLDTCTLPLPILPLSYFCVGLSIAITLKPFSISPLISLTPYPVHLSTFSINIGTSANGSPILFPYPFYGLI